MKASRFLNESGFRALLRAASERRRVTARRDRFLFLFLGRTGLRISEALGLGVSSLHLDADPPFVAVDTLKKRRRVTDEVLLDGPAVKACRRYVKVEWRKYQRENEILLPKDAWFTYSLGPLFPGMGRRNASKLFRFYAKRAGLPEGLTLHSLRHYRATVLLNRTQDLTFTRDQLRHSTISSTEAYLHYSPEQVKRYLSRLSRRRIKA